MDVDQDATVVNWVGKCEQVCTQKRISLKPEYTFEEDTVAKVFICTSSLRDIRVQERATSKKKAKNLVAKLMYDELLKLKEQEVPFKPAKEKLPIDKTDDVQPPQMTDNLPNDLQKELEERSSADHVNHKCCVSSERLLVKVCSMTGNNLLNKLWPNRKMNFFLDANNLIALSNESCTNFKVQDKYRVFLIIHDAVTNRTFNVFTGAGNTVNNARSLAACRGLSYIQARFGIR